MNAVRANQPLAPCATPAQAGGRINQLCDHLGGGHGLSHVK